MAEPTRVGISPLSVSSCSTKALDDMDKAAAITTACKTSKHETRSHRKSVSVPEGHVTSFWLPFSAALRTRCPAALLRWASWLRCIAGWVAGHMGGLCVGLLLTSSTERIDTRL